MTDFNVPDATLKQLGEFSGGGFILFIYDQNGTPRTYADFDSAAHGLGMQKFMQNSNSDFKGISRKGLQ